MEDLAPPLELCLYLEWSLEGGDSLRTALTDYLKSHNNDFCSDLQVLLLSHIQGTSSEGIRNRSLNLYRSSLIDLLQKGLAGEPVLSSLKWIRKDLEQACLLQLRADLQKLPLLSLVPLLLFIFPAFLILLFGPLLLIFSKGW